MSYEEAVRSITLNADSTLARYTGMPGIPGSASPNYGMLYRFVKIAGPRLCGLATAADASVIGVLNNKPQVGGQAATVAIRGDSLVMAGAAFKAGDLLAPDAQGRAVKAADASKAVAIALEDATAADTLSTALLRIN